ncbi:hypothetical protein I4U23_007683 [Adineta vaga]|nr:hypothetical protein I4U23_007683 [Adineta vaga]
MQFQLSDQYISEEIYEARDEILKLQQNLNKIEELYRYLYSTFDEQQVHMEEIDKSIYQTQTNIEKSDSDFYELLQIRKKKDQRRCYIVIFIFTIASVFFLFVISVLINVVNTFRFRAQNKF